MSEFSKASFKKRVLARVLVRPQQEPAQKQPRSMHDGQNYSSASAYFSATPPHGVGLRGLRGPNRMCPWRGRRQNSDMRATKVFDHFRQTLENHHHEHDGHDDGHDARDA